LRAFGKGFVFRGCMTEKRTVSERSAEELGDPKRRMRSCAPVCFKRVSASVTSLLPHDITMSTASSASRPHGLRRSSDMRCAEQHVDACSAPSESRPEGGGAARDEMARTRCSSTVSCGGGVSVVRSQGLGLSMWGSLPDDIIVHVLRYISNASELLALCEVCSHWNHLIHSTPELWRTTRFHGLRFSRRVEFAHLSTLAQSSPPQVENIARTPDGDAVQDSEAGPRCVAHRCSSVPVACSSKKCLRRMVLETPRGEHILQLAARAGNKFASLLLSVAFDGGGIAAATLLPPDARRVLRAGVGLRQAGSKAQRESRPNRITVELPCEVTGSFPTWVAIHAARDISRSPRRLVSQDDATILDTRAFQTDALQPSVPRGAIIGLVHLTDCRRSVASPPTRRSSLPSANALTLAGSRFGSPSVVANLESPDRRMRAILGRSSGATGSMLQSRRSAEYLHFDSHRARGASDNDTRSTSERRFCWTIDEGLLLESPITCAGYHGAWKLGPEMSEVLVRAPMTGEPKF